MWIRIDLPSLDQDANSYQECRFRIRIQDSEIGIPEEKQLRYYKFGRALTILLNE